MPLAENSWKAGPRAAAAISASPFLSAAFEVPARARPEQIRFVSRGTLTAYYTS